MNRSLLIIGGIIIIIIIIGVFISMNPSSQPAPQDQNQGQNSASSTAMDMASSTASTTATSTTAETAQKGDHVYVNYTGTLENGKVFDSSYTRGVPIDFILGEGQVIPGWDKGILGMTVGEKKHLVIPPADGYGAQAITDSQGNVLIPANSTLIFDVELVKIDK
jgi:FKBP-type peptidyl-prolyl cis-trans isomerase